MAMDKAACLSGCAEMLVPLIETKKKKKLSDCHVPWPYALRFLPLNCTLRNNGTCSACGAGLGLGLENRFLGSPLKKVDIAFADPEK